MAAAAAAARKPAQQQQGDPVKLPAWFTKHGGWTPFHNDFDEVASSTLTGTEFKIAYFLNRMTVGALPERPEWIRITEVELAAKVGADPKEVSDSLKALETGDKRIVESRKVGTRKEYRLLPERYRLLPARIPRVLNIKKKMEPVRLGEAAAMQPGEVRRLELPPKTEVSDVVVRNDSDRAAVVSSSFTGSTVTTVFKALPSETRTPVPVSSRRIHKVETGTQVPVSRAKSSPLCEFVTEYFLKMGEPPPDEKLINDIRQELGDATLDEYRGVIQKRFQQGDARRIRRGLFKNMAADARNLHAAVARRQPEPPPPPRPSTFVVEPEHSTSPWAKIRNVVKQHITEVEYKNWFVRTRHGKLDAGKNQLTVLVPDEISALMLKEEFEVRLMRWAVDAGFPLNNLFFQVAEENS